MWLGEFNASFKEIYVFFEKKKELKLKQNKLLLGEKVIEKGAKMHKKCCWVTECSVGMSYVQSNCSAVLSSRALARLDYTTLLSKNQMIF